MSSSYKKDEEVLNKIIKKQRHCDKPKYQDCASNILQYQTDLEPYRTKQLSSPEQRVARSRPCISLRLQSWGLQSPKHHVYRVNPYNSIQTTISPPTNRNHKETQPRNA